MGRFTDEQLVRMAPGRSPEELAMLNLTDGEFERQYAEARESLAQSTHELEVIRNEGLHSLNSVRFDTDIRAAARVEHNKDPAGPSVDEIIEAVVVPIREAYLASYESKAPVAAPRAGPNELAFNKLVQGGSDG